MAEGSQFVKQSITDEGSRRQEFSLLNMDDEMFAAEVSKNAAYHDSIISLNKFGDLLSFYMKENGIDEIDLELASGVSERTIRKMKKDEEYEPNIETVLCISFAMHIGPVDTYRLLALAGRVLRNNKKHNLYRLLVEHKEINDLDTCNKILKRAGYQELTPKPKPRKKKSE